MAHDLPCVCAVREIGRDAPAQKDREALRLPVLCKIFLHEGHPLHLEAPAPEVVQDPRVRGEVEAEIVAVEGLPGLAIAAVGVPPAGPAAEALRILTAKIRDREITKRYLCVTLGAPEPREGRLECFC